MFPSPALLFVLGVALNAFSTVAPAKLHFPASHTNLLVHRTAIPLDSWIPQQSAHSLAAIAAAMSQPGAAEGAVVASPSRRNPDYYYSWVRDAALTMDAALSIAETHLRGSPGEHSPQWWREQLEAHARLARKLQTTPSEGSYGEPKYYLDGRPFTGPWGRPQNDGPALRAMTLSRYALALLRRDRYTDITRLYTPDYNPPTSPIKADLEYVAHRWRDASFDIWEEVKGTHFYTRLVQHRALRRGAELSACVLDHGAVDYFRAQAAQIADSVANAFWDAKGQYLRATISRSGRYTSKDSEMDIQVVLASLHAAHPGTEEEWGTETLFAPDNDRILATATKLEDAFMREYHINAINQDKPPAMGRYTEDIYDGHTMTRGNPWTLATAAMAELNYRVAAILSKRQMVTITKLSRPFYAHALPTLRVLPSSESMPMTIRFSSPEFEMLIRGLVDRGDAYLRRVQYHAPADYNLQEQINRDTGMQQGATELTWSHASFETAIMARHRAQHAVTSTVLRSYILTMRKAKLYIRSVASVA